MNPFTPIRLDQTLKALAPIESISVGTHGDSAKCSILFLPAATAPQRTAAQNALTNFDWSDAATVAWLDAQNPNRTNFRNALAAALSANATYVALANPTVAQNTAQVKALTQQMTAVLKRLADLS